MPTKYTICLFDLSSNLFSLDSFEKDAQNVRLKIFPTLVVHFPRFSSNLTHLNREKSMLFSFSKLPTLPDTIYRIFRPSQVPFKTPHRRTSTSERVKTFNSKKVSTVLFPIDKKLQISITVKQSHNVSKTCEMTIL